jgi:hypothetical protein
MSGSGTHVVLQPEHVTSAFELLRFGNSNGPGLGLTDCPVAQSATFPCQTKVCTQIDILTLMIQSVWNSFQATYKPMVFEHDLYPVPKLVLGSQSVLILTTDTSTCSIPSLWTAKRHLS